jgi:hypothetical protein
MVVFVICGLQFGYSELQFWNRDGVWFCLDDSFGILYIMI